MRDALPQNCFRKALACLDWKNPEQGIAPAPSQAVSYGTTTAVSSSLTDSRVSAKNLLELGRFELLRNRCVRRASAFFKACLAGSPWHASAKVLNGN